MKGTTTQQKLATLASWLRADNLSTTEFVRREIQVQNYLNALSRGGQIEVCDLNHTVACQITEAVIRR
jgi:hypothetical protein